MPRRKFPLRLAYLDIETAPNTVFSWSLFPKYISIADVVESGYTLCFAVKWHGERGVEYYSIDKDGFEGMVRKAHAVLDDADAVVHYNGTRFDIPILNKEFVKSGLHPPSHHHDIDLLKTVRKRFKFSSNKLDFVCRELGLGNKVQHKGMKLWEECMEGNPAAWKQMERYNKQDVRLLPRLYDRLLPWIHNHPNLGLWIDDPTKPVCPHCASTKVVKKGTQFNTTATSYDRWFCTKCGTPLRSRLSSRRTSPNVLKRTP